MSTNRPTLVVRNVLLSGQNELLMGLRSDTILWEVPGGKVEDEGVIEAAIREQLEETGITLEGEPVLLGYYDGLGVKKPDTRYTELFFLWPSWHGFARLEEEAHLKWCWFGLSPDRLPASETLMPSTRHLLSSLLPHYLEAMEKAKC